jgi:hypothetical protein
MLRLERDTYIDFEHALAQGLRLVALQRRAYSVDGAFPYSGYTVSSRGVQKGLTSAAGVDSSATGHTFLVVANLTAVSSDAVAFGRLRYNGGANYGAGLRFNAAALEIDGGVGTSAWHYSVSSSAVQTGRHVYAGAIGVGDTTSTGRLWRDGALLTTGVHSATAYAASRWDGQVDLGGGTATGASAITGAISGHIESGLYYARSLPTEDVEYLSAAMLRGRLPFMRSRRIWVPVSAGGGSYSLQVTPGSYSITGNDVSLIAARSVQVTPGAYAITGNDVGLAAGVVLSALTGSYAYAGSDVVLTTSRQLAVTAGSYAITGNVAGLNAARLLTATPGAYSISGNSVILTYNTVGSYTLNVTAGSYAITGNDVALTASRTLAVTPGAYAITGNDVGLTYGVMHTLNVTPGAYAITGYSAMLAKASTLQALAGAYAYTGRNVVLTYSGLADGALDVVHLLSRVTPNVQLLAALTQTVRLQGHVPEFAGLSSPIP